MQSGSVFEPVFGPKWPTLPGVLKQRYANRAHCDDEVVVDGTLTIHRSWWITILSPFLRLTGALLPYAGSDIPVQVRFNSRPHDNRIGFNRTFHFPGRKPYHFSSQLAPTQGDEVIEFMRFGLGWRMHLVYADNQVQLQHAGYVWRIAGFDLPIPLGLILGKSHAYEYAINDTQFGMHFAITHPLFGNVFGYEGQFTLTQTRS